MGKQNGTTAGRNGGVNRFRHPTTAKKSKKCVSYEDPTALQMTLFWWCAVCLFGMVFVWPHVSKKL